MFRDKNIYVRNAVAFSALLATSSLFFSGAALAQQRQFNIAAGDANSTIPAFALQSGIQIIAPADQLQGVHTPAISGNIDSRAALHQLLQSTGLSVASDDGGSVIVLRTRQSAGFQPASYQASPAVTAAPARERPVVLAQASPSRVDSGQVASDIIVTGTRTTGMQAVDSPAPIQLLSSDVLQRTAQPDLVQSLAQNLPFVQAQSFGTDLQQVNLQMRLRGLSPNQTLILVNGKRRHVSANVSVAGGVFNGAVSPDISFLPSESIERVEVLQDGAAAQYGTDAIAGVINFIMKKSSRGGSLSGTAGKYFDEGGKTWAISGNIGLEPFDGAYLNITGERRHKGSSFRGGPLYQWYGDSAVAKGNIAKYPDVVNAKHYPYMERRTGDQPLDIANILYNAGYVFGDFEVYSFGSYGHKNAIAMQVYRGPNIMTCKINATFCALEPGDATDSTGTLKVARPQGFDPYEKFSETDYAFTGGFKGVIGNTTFDVASTYGNDIYHVWTMDSGNAQMYAQKGWSPVDFYAGNINASQWSNTLDLTHEVDVGLSLPITIAGGLEYRRETFGIGQGDEASYWGGIGAQSFKGWTPSDSGNYSRTNFSQYLDISLNPTEKWLIDGAVRHERYSDFGDTTVFKFTTRYDFSDAIAIRGTVSTGFRAPTLNESFYSGVNVSPNYMNGVMAPNGAALKALGFPSLKPEKSTNFSLGLVLHPIDRLTVTIDGYMIKLRDRIVQMNQLYGYYGQYCPPAGDPTAIQPGPLTSCVPVTAARPDNYQIYNQSLIYNAMINYLDAAMPSTILYMNGDPAQGRYTEGYVSMQTFVNGLSMRTQGIDVVATYSSDIGPARINWSLSGTYNQNKVTDVYPLPAGLYISAAQPGLTQLFSDSDIIGAEHSSPRFRAVAGANISIGKLNINLKENYYSSTYARATVQPNYIPSGAGDLKPGEYYRQYIDAAFITDLDISYQIAEPIKISIGANNLFNKYPNLTSWEYNREPTMRRGTNIAGGGSQTGSSYGYNGGYYYARVGVKF